MRLTRLLLTLMFIFVTACTPTWGTQTVPPETPALPPGYTPYPTVTRLVPPTQTVDIKNLWVSPAVPDLLWESAVDAGMAIVPDQEGADYRLDLVPVSTETSTTWIYALVVPYPTITDEVSLEDILNNWHGAGTGPFAGIPLLMDESTLVVFTNLWGMPGAGAVRVEGADQLIDTAWSARPSWGIVPFEALEPGWKVLSVDGQSPVHNDFDGSTYPLKASFALDPAFSMFPVSNRDPEKLTVLIMTGVTALVRSTAYRMETKGLTYPGEDIRDTFRAADLLHISNEVPFAENCPYPYPIQASLRFCTDMRYITLLEDIGTDIIELTGNHFQDYGSEATLMTIDMYEQRGWVYFGGGRNQADARKAIIIEDHGNKIAFIGCNEFGLEPAWATDDSPGSAYCEYEFMYSEIARLKSEGILPIVTFQYYETYALYPTYSQIVDFRLMVDAGAEIVSGSQSHFPQYMEFYGDGFVHYGLGNLFFDQMDYPVVGTRREFADRHVIYDGRHISTELLTFMLEDYARPRPMSEVERATFLRDVFAEAGWSE